MAEISEEYTKLPFDENGQMAVIGWMLKNREFCYKCKAHLSDNIFVNSQLGDIFNTIIDFTKEYNAIPTMENLITVFQPIKKKDEFEKIRKTVNDCIAMSGNYDLPFLQKGISVWLQTAIFRDYTIKVSPHYRNANIAVMQSLMRSTLDKIGQTNFQKGVNYEFGDPLKDLTTAVENKESSVTTGVREFDAALGGGLFRGEHTVVLAPTNVGKCNAINTPIIMNDGTIKMVQDIKVGEQLMGPDGKPRNVLSTTKGYGPLYKIIPKAGGEPFICNDVHVLSLKFSKGREKWLAERRIKKFEPGKIVNIPLNEYLKESKLFKTIARLWRAELEFSEKTLSIDPYILGLWLGDGNNINAGLTTMDEEIKNDWLKWINNNKDNFREYTRPNNAATQFSASKKDRTFVESNLLLRNLGVLNNKHIPHDYLTSSRQQRLELLAGIIDTDGYYTGRGYEISTKLEQLSKDYAYLARSLGFKVKVSLEQKTDQNGTAGEYYRVMISGKLTQIPCRLFRKQAKKDCTKDPLLSGFDVEYVGEGDYYGFTLDGDHLYLLGDFTVTHNTTFCLNMIYHNLLAEKHVLFVVHEGVPLELMNKLRQRFLNLTSEELLAIPVNKDPNKIADLNVVENIFKKFLVFKPILKSGGLYVEDVIDEIKTEQEKLFAKEGKYFDLVVDDYPAKLQSRHFNSRHDKRNILQYVYEEFHRVAMEFDCHSISPVQINREGYKLNKQREPGEYLGVDNISESFGIPQDADNAITLNRSDLDDRNEVLYVNVDKTRRNKHKQVLQFTTDYSRCITHDQQLGCTLLSAGSKNTTLKALNEEIDKQTNES